MGRATLVELLHLVTGLAVTAAIFRGAAWAYPPARDSLDPIGWVTMLAVLAMSVPELAKARAVDRNMKDENLG